MLNTTIITKKQKQEDEKRSLNLSFTRIFVECDENSPNIGNMVPI
jgi:hypothetical protein